MAKYAQNYVTSVYGNRLGLSKVTSSQFGSTVGPALGVGSTGRLSPDFLVGPVSFRHDISTARTSAQQLPAWGIDVVTSTGGTTNTMYTLDRPIPGVEKWIVWGSSDTASNEISVWASSDSSIFIHSTQGSTPSVMRSTAGYRGVTRLLGLTTSIWLTVPHLSSANISLTSKCS